MSRHTVEHDYTNPHHSELLDRFYDAWGLGDDEVARRYQGHARHARHIRLRTGAVTELMRRRQLTHSQLADLAHIRADVLAQALQGEPVTPAILAGLVLALRVPFTEVAA